MKKTQLNPEQIALILEMNGDSGSTDQESDEEQTQQMSSSNSFYKPSKITYGTTPELLQEQKSLEKEEKRLREQIGVKTKGPLERIKIFYKNRISKKNEYYPRIGDLVGTVLTRLEKSASELGVLVKQIGNNERRLIDFYYKIADEAKKSSIEKDLAYVQRCEIETKYNTLNEIVTSPENYKTADLIDSMKARFKAKVGIRENTINYAKGILGVDIGFKQMHDLENITEFLSGIRLSKSLRLLFTLKTNTYLGKIKAAIDDLPETMKKETEIMEAYQEVTEILGAYKDIAAKLYAHNVRTTQHLLGPEEAMKLLN